MNNILQLDSNNCSGCAVCAAVCPTSAITFGQDERGFYMPFVDESKCISCGKCRNVCLKGGISGRKITDGKLYAARLFDEKVTAQCSSGGIAWDITALSVKQGRYVAGCVYDVTENKAKHIVARTLEECEGFKNSKYIQSETEDCFKQLVEIAKADPSASFTVFGLPCQIYGIRKAFENLPNDLLCVELFCHGVPTHKLWESYLDYLGIENIKEVNFRHKRDGWHQFGIFVRGESEEHFGTSAPVGRDYFYKVFFDENVLRDSCIDCKLRKFESLADIRLGDFWGKRYIHDNKGVSAVLTLTEKGEEVVSLLEGTEIMEKDIPLTDYRYTCFEDKKDVVDIKSREKALELLARGKTTDKVVRGVFMTYPLKKKYIRLRLELKSLLKKRR